MTKKDYERIARVIHDATNHEEDRMYMAFAFADEFGADEAFDRAKFLDACAPIGIDYNMVDRRERRHWV